MAIRSGRLIVWRKLLLFQHIYGCISPKMDGNFQPVTDFLPNLEETILHVISNPYCLKCENILTELMGIIGRNRFLYVPILLSNYEEQILNDNSQKAAVNGLYVQALVMNISGLETGLEKTGFTHLYIMDSQNDIRNAIKYQFVYFNIRKASPRFILFWSTANLNNINWKEEFQAPIFYKSFKDYRLLIAKQSVFAKYRVWLICTICLLHQDKNLQDLYLSPVHKNTMVFLRQL